MGKKIFVVKQGGIGDVILATPILAELKNQYPDCWITLMVFQNAVDVVTGLSFIDEVFTYNKEKDSIWKLYRKMRGNDMAVFLDLSYRPAMVAALARIPVRIGIEHKRKFWLTHKIKWQEYMDHIYEPYVFGDILKESIGLNIPREKLNKLYIAEADGTDKGKLWEKLQRGNIHEGDRYVVCSPVTAFFLKNWPLERWNELFIRIYREYGMPSVIFGGGKLAFNWNKEAVVDLWGQLNLRQTGELIKNAVMLVNSCSMPIHMASAVDTPCVVLYGYGDPARWAPRNNCTTIKTDLACSPCDGYHGSTCQDPICMKRMSVEEVFGCCRKVLANIEK